MTDKIIIKDLKVFAYHGVNEEEKINGQNFVLDVTLYLSLEKACLTDDINDTVSYAKVSKLVLKVMTEKSYNLLECAVSNVALRIMNEYPCVASVKVCLKKPEAPIKADFSYMAVEIVRSRSDYDEASSN